MKNNENGRSMVEMLGVLAIIGVLSAGGLAGYSKAMFKHKLNNTMDQITMLVTNIRTMYGSQGNYEGLSNVEAVNLGIVPTTMKGAATAATSSKSATQGLVNPFKGGVEILTINAKGGTDNQTGFTIEYTGLPTEACIALASTDFGSGAGSGFIGVTAQGEAGTNKGTEKSSATAIGGGTSPYSEGMALQMDDAIDACQGTTAKVKWYFY